MNRNEQRLQTLAHKQQLQENGFNRDECFFSIITGRATTSSRNKYTARILSDLRLFDIQDHVVAHSDLGAFEVNLLSL